MRFSSSKFLIVLAFLLVGTIQVCRENLANLLSQDSAVNHTFIPSPYGIRLIALGFDQLIADCYWLRFISYVGDTSEREKDKYALSDEYLELITGLDPYLVKAYWFAAFIVGNEQRRPKKAAELIERGIRANQDNWYLPFIAGINQYLYAGNEIAAAKYYRQAAKYPDAPEWLYRQADILEARIPSRIKEINVWSNIYSTDTDTRVREMAHQKLIELWGRVIATHPPPKIRARAVDALKDLGVDVEFYLNQIKNSHQN